mgnify:CR=1 FL=1
MRIKRSTYAWSFTPVLAETEVKSVSTATADAKKDDAKADTTDKKDDAKDAVLEDGTYSAEFDTDSGMFHVNEANDGKGVLTVKDGKMTLHVSLASKNIVNLFVGTAEDAQKDWCRTSPADNRYCYIQRWNVRRSLWF